MAAPVQHRVYEYIQEHINEHGYSPSLAEVARGIGISPKSISLVSRSIHALVAAGRLQFGKKGYRNIELVSGGSFVLPLMGRIAAGAPIEAIEDRQSIDLGSLLKAQDNFALEVRGDSMIDEGILDGDLVICRHASEAREGDIIVALIDNLEATLKRISFQIADRVTLIPANAALKPKAYLPHRVQVQGVFVGLLRLR
jgi:repressor LexA